MKRINIFKKIFVIIISLIIIFTGYKQYQVECYIIKQKAKYGILIDKKRIHYLPFVFHFLSGEINNTRNYRAESKAFFMAYDIASVKSAYTDKDFDSYMVYCYFSKKEIDDYFIK